VIRRPRAVLDVSELPDVCFGPRDIMWWGTVGFMLIEGFTLVLCAVVYVYLQQNFAAWPPPGIPRPSLGAPTAQVAVMLASLPVAAWIKRSAYAFDLSRVRVGLIVASSIGAVCVALRAAELLVSLHVKWDTNAYGSAQWLVIGSHSTLLLIEWAETVGLTLLFWLAPVERKHFSDAADAVDYWYFMVAVWIPLAVLCYVVPRWI
jgi:heme/copper-type cytochrome/quinol oxidase subunit 3